MACLCPAAFPLRPNLLVPGVQDGKDLVAGRVVQYWDNSCLKIREKYSPHPICNIPNPLYP